jgi:hypothetical protein
MESFMSMPLFLLLLSVVGITLLIDTYAVVSAFLQWRSRRRGGGTKR